MCFKKKLTPVKYRALLFGDNYPGTSHALSECINDIEDVAATFEGFEITKFKNKEVTRNRFESEIKNALSVGRAGDFLLIWYSGHGTQSPSNHEPDGYDEALYLDDGVFTDDRLTALQQITPDGMTVVASFDSCFSAGMAKGVNPFRNRFYQIPGVKRFKKRVKAIVKADSKWVINAGCGEGQTCADAPDLGNGAFTYYYLKSYLPGETLRNVMKKTKTFLPNKEYDQIPDILGNDKLFDVNYPLKSEIMNLKAVYDKAVPTRNLVTTISGIVALIITILVQFGVFTPEQAGQVTEHTNTLLTAIPQVISAIAALILVFKAKDA